MSISSLTAVAVARNTGVPTKSDAGELTQDATGADEQATLPQLLVKQVPTGMVAAYTAVTAATVELIDEATAANPNPDELFVFRWLAFGVLVVVSALLTYVSYQTKAAPRARKPVAEVLGVVIAAAGWGLVIPDSPLLAALDGDRGTAAVLFIGFVAVALNLVVAARLQKPAVPSAGQASGDAN